MFPLFILILLLLTSCNQDRIEELENQLSEKQSELDEAEDTISEIQIHIDDLELAVSELRNEVDDFGYEEWKYNVPDVENATTNVETELEELKNVSY